MMYLSLGQTIFSAIVFVAIVFLLWVLYHFIAESRQKAGRSRHISILVSSKARPTAPRNQSRIPTAFFKRQNV